MEQKNESFQFTYSAAQQAEIQAIRRKYLPREETKLEQLRRLDHSAFQKAQAWALTLGIIGALVMGAGMSFIMTDLGSILGINHSSAMLIGICIGLIGIVLVALAYPVFNRILRKERCRIAPEVLRLTDELMQG